MNYLPIKKINYKIDEELALLELYHYLPVATDYSDSRGKVDGWKVMDARQSVLGNRICHDLNLNATIRYYLLTKGVEVPVHVDNNVLCSINFLLGSKHEPIVYPDYGNFKYKYAIIDTTKPHAVPASKHDRLMLRLSIKDKSYEEIVSQYEARLSNIAL